jgi:hypothetical protein
MNPYESPEGLDAPDWARPAETLLTYALMCLMVFVGATLFPVSVVVVCYCALQERSRWGYALAAVYVLILPGWVWLCCEILGCTFSNPW